MGLNVRVTLIFFYIYANTSMWLDPCSTVFPAGITFTVEPVTKDPVPKAPKPFIVLLTVPVSPQGGLGDGAAVHRFSVTVNLLEMRITAVLATQHARWHGERRT